MLVALLYSSLIKSRCIDVGSNVNSGINGSAISHFYSDTRFRPAPAPQANQTKMVEVAPDRYNCGLFRLMLANFAVNYRPIHSLDDKKRFHCVETRCFHLSGVNLSSATILGRTRLCGTTTTGYGGWCRHLPSINVLACHWPRNLEQRLRATLPSPYRWPLR